MVNMMVARSTDDRLGKNLRSSVLRASSPAFMTVSRHSLACSLFQMSWTRKWMKPAQLGGTKARSGGSDLSPALAEAGRNRGMHKRQIVRRVIVYLLGWRLRAVG